MMLQLGDHLQLAEALAEDLSEGRIITLTGQPSSGRSSIVDLVASQLEDLVTCIRVRGDDEADSLTSALDAAEEAVASEEPTACLVEISEGCSPQGTRRRFRGAFTLLP